MSGDLSGVTLRVVRDVEDAEEFLRWLSIDREVLAIDSETTGFEWWQKDFTRLVQFGDCMTGWTLSAKHWLGLIEIALERYTGDVVFHNAAFDQHALENLTGQCVPWHRVHDTLVLHHLENPSVWHGLKPASEKLWGWAAVAGEKLLKLGMSKNNWTWATVPLSFEPYSTYAALDTVLTARLYEILSPSIKARGMWGAYEVEMGCKAVMYRCEHRGLRVDPTYTLALRDAWTAEKTALRYELFDHGIANPNSSPQVMKALQFQGFDPEEFTETGQPKLDKVVLADIMTQFGVPAEIASKVQRYRRLEKWVATYLDAFLGKRSDDTWHVHPSINTMAARTGRMSITGPPLQTLPRGAEIRHCILPDEGHHLYAVDYDAQELRLFAHFSQEQGLIDAFERGIDPHRHTASLVYNTPYDEVLKDDPRRQLAKNVRFASLYGAGPARIAQTAGVTVEEVEHFIRTSASVFPRIKEFTDELDIIGRTRLSESGVPYVWSWAGRYLPADPDKVYALMNFLIQGTAADVIKRKIVALDQAGYGDWIMLPVHDELLLNVPTGGDEHMPGVKSIMEEHDAFTVPLTCHVTGPCSSWGWAAS